MNSSNFFNKNHSKPIKSSQNIQRRKTVDFLKVNDTPQTKLDTLIYVGV